jgi:hypothetical protein
MHVGVRNCFLAFVFLCDNAFLDQFLVLCVALYLWVVPMAG